MSKRLQGESWYNYRRTHKLILLNIYISSHGNYRADVVDEKGRHFFHWLHPIEAAKLKCSGYLDTHPALDSNLIYLKARISDEKKTDESLLDKKINEAKNA